MLDECNLSTLIWRDGRARNFRVSRVRGVMGMSRCVSISLLLVSWSVPIYFEYRKSKPPSGDTSLGAQDGKRNLPIQIRQSKTDIFNDGAPGPMVEIDSVYRPVKTSREWERMAVISGDGESRALGPRLREPASTVMKTEALSNGVLDKRIDANSLREGGDTTSHT